MLSDAFKQLLAIQQHLYGDILQDCTPYASCDHVGDALLHGRIVETVTKLTALTDDFCKAAEVMQTREDKRAACKILKPGSALSMALYQYLLTNIDKATVFRRAALKNHAEMMFHMNQQQIITINHIVYNECLDGVDRIAQMYLDGPLIPDNPLQDYYRARQKQQNPRLTIVK